MSFWSNPLKVIHNVASPIVSVYHTITDTVKSVVYDVVHVASDLGSLAKHIVGLDFHAVLGDFRALANDAGAAIEDVKTVIGNVKDILVQNHHDAASNTSMPSTDAGNSESPLLLAISDFIIDAISKTSIGQSVAPIALTAARIIDHDLQAIVPTNPTGDAQIAQALRADDIHHLVTMNGVVDGEMVAEAGFIQLIGVYGIV